jgi:alkanesulfonate monooxygenase SsuD/methylene tetrahydromethanopterin reductase-like flavin-dependent oxidoreductase (luciferase family)
VAFRPTPLQQPPIPLWGAVRGGSPARPLRRAAGLDGLFPVFASLDQLDDMLDVVARERGSLDGYDVAFWASPEADLTEHAAHGVTWSIWGPEEDEPSADTFAFVGAGPPAT